MTRFLKSAAAIAAVATLATIQIAAAGQGRGGAAAGGPAGPGPGPLPILRGLNLTDSQREQIRSIARAEREQNGPRAGADLHRQLQLALFSETPDQGKIEELKAAIATESAARLARRIELETRIAQVLTPEQRTLLRDRVSKAGGRGGPMARRLRGGRV